LDYKEYVKVTIQKFREDISIDATEVEEVGRYDTNGRLLSKPAHGVNIIKMSDGSTRKEWVK
jgi:hypothetical protein